MRFIVLIALVVATFVSSRSTYVSAEMYALGDDTYDNPKVVRRLEDDSNVPAERGFFNMALTGKTLLPGKAKMQGDVYSKLGKNAPEELKKAGLDLPLLHKGDLAQMEKLVELVVKGVGKEKAMWLKVLGWVAKSVGVVSFIGLMYLLITGGPKGSEPTTVIGTVTPGGA